MEAILHRVFSAIGKAHVGLRPRGDLGAAPSNGFSTTFPKGREQPATNRIRQRRRSVGLTKPECQGVKASWVSTKVPRATIPPGLVRAALVITNASSPEGPADRAVGAECAAGWLGGRICCSTATLDNYRRIRTAIVADARVL
jgi:hypothetical protein